MTKNKNETHKKFSKDAFVRSGRFSGRVDLIRTLLEDDKTYTIKEVEDLISSYLKTEVN